MPHKASVKRKTTSAQKQATLRAIRRAGGEVVLRHALGMASVAYQVYPVGPPHTDGTPHTRDTFALIKDGKVIADKGDFNRSPETYEFSGAVSGGKGLKFIAAGASFFLEFGTIYIEPMPILRTLIKKAKADITNDLRKLNIRKGQL